MVSTIATLTTENALGYASSFQRKCFYARGRHWVFYSDGTWVLWRSSEDAINWSTPTNISAADTGQRISVVLDGDQVHYAREYGGPLYYRRGALNTDGTITWMAEQTAYTPPALHGTHRSMIAIDSDGYPWIGFIRRDNTGAYHPFVTRSDANDGTWVTTAGFPVQLSAVNSDLWGILVVALQANRMYVLYGYNGVVIVGRLWTGAVLDPQEAVSTSTMRTCEMDAIGEADNVHLVFIHRTVGLEHQILYQERVYGVGWTAEQELRDMGTYNSTPGISIDRDLEIFYCFWLETQTIYFLRNIGGTWDSEPFIWETEDYAFKTAGYGYPVLNCFLQKYFRRIGVTWLIEIGVTYDLRYDMLTLLPAEIKTSPHAGI